MSICREAVGEEGGRDTPKAQKLGDTCTLESRPLSSEIITTKVVIVAVLMILNVISRTFGVRFQSRIVNSLDLGILHSIV